MCKIFIRCWVEIFVQAKIGTIYFDISVLVNKRSFSKPGLGISSDLFCPIFDLKK